MKSAASQPLGSRVVVRVSPELELEIFCHGAMCVSYSGRCLLSNYMTGRDSNRGACAQPCRYQYALMEEKRPGQYYPVEEDGHYSYILNAKDLCLIEYLDKLAKAGVHSFKIEGRAKSAYYTAVTAGAYRAATDLMWRDPEHYRCPDWLREEVTKVSHRDYTTGFLFGPPEAGPAISLTTAVSAFPKPLQNNPAGDRRRSSPPEKPALFPGESAVFLHYPGKNRRCGRVYPHRAGGYR